MAQVVQAKELPERVLGLADHERKEKARRKVDATGQAMKGKKFKNMTAKEKDDLLLALALQAGLMDDNDDE